MRFARRVLLAVALAGLPLGAGAQQSGVELIIEPNPNVDTGPVVVQGSGALLRLLDKSLGRSQDVDLATGETFVQGRIAVELLECRYPEETPGQDAFAHLRVTDIDGVELFNGWMIASSPALSALEHSRYDVWVLRCTISSGETSDG